MTCADISIKFFANKKIATSVVSQPPRNDARVVRRNPSVASATATLSPREQIEKTKIPTFLGRDLPYRIGV